MALTFELTDEQEQQIKDWNKTHACHEPTKRAKRRHLKYEFTPTGMGDIIKVECTGCGKIKDVTDNSKW